jgi:hypothetical protein
VGEAPEPPGKRSAQLDPAEIDHRAPLADRRQVAGVLVAERRRRGLTGKPRPYRLRDIGALLLGGRRDARNGPSVRADDDRRIADREDLVTLITVTLYLTP